MSSSKGRRRTKNSVIPSRAGNVTAGQSLVTEYYATVKRGSRSGLKRVKLSDPNSYEQFSSCMPQSLEASCNLRSGINPFTSVKKEENSSETNENDRTDGFHGNDNSLSYSWNIGDDSVMRLDTVSENQVQGSVNIAKTSKVTALGADVIVSKDADQDIVTPSEICIKSRTSLPHDQKPTKRKQCTSASAARRALLFSSSSPAVVNLPEPQKCCSCEQSCASTGSLVDKANLWRNRIENNAEIRNKLQKARSVQELQDRLASRGGLRKIHEQKMSNNCEKVEVLKHALLSPAKEVKIGLCAKSLPTTDLRPKRFGESVSASDTVLPAPVKQQALNADDDLQLRKLDYGRASRLVGEVKENARLPLPKKFAHLSSLFEHMERVVSILTAQGKRITLSEVIKNVQRNIKCNFNKSHFAQIVYIYPSAYKIRLEEKWAPIGGVRNCSEGTRVEYVIEPNFDEDLIGSMQPDTPMKAEAPLPPVTPTKLISPIKGRYLTSSYVPRPSPSKRNNITRPVEVKPRSARVDERPKLEAWRMVARLAIFKHRLQLFIKDQHSKFMERIGMPMTSKESDKLCRLHPDFDLSNIDDIPEAQLPSYPKGDEMGPKEMRDYMKTVADSVGTLPYKIKEVIKELRSPEKMMFSPSSDGTALSPRKYAMKNELEPKTMSLLQRIRAKEQAKKRLEKMRDPAMEAKKAKLENLSRSLLRNICSFYAFKKVGSMKLVELVDRMVFSCGSYTKAEMEAHIVLLCEVASEYFVTTTVCNVKYVQLKKNDFSAIHEIVDGTLALFS